MFHEITQLFRRVPCQDGANLWIIPLVQCQYCRHTASDNWIKSGKISGKESHLTGRKFEAPDFRNEVSTEVV
jgi:hypothetical protein